MCDDETQRGPVIGYVVDENPQITACVGCVFGDNLGPQQGEIRDNGAYGDKVPYPECGHCGEVIRPQETETVYECTRCGDRFETISAVDSHSKAHNGEVDVALFDIVEREEVA